MSMGTRVQKAREKKFAHLKYTGEQRKALAKACGVAESYISFIERNRPVHCSQRVADEINRVLGSTVIDQASLRRHNRIAREYVQKWKAKRAPAKKSTKKAA